MVEQPHTQPSVPDIAPDKRDQLRELLPEEVLGAESRTLPIKFQELEEIIAAIRKDGKVSENEVSPLRVAKLREEMITMQDRWRKLQGKTDKQSQEQRNDIERKWNDTAEQIGEEIVFLNTVALFGKLQGRYFAMKKQMKGQFNANVVLGTESAQGVAEQKMQQQWNNIEQGLRERAAIVTVKEQYNDALEGKMTWVAFHSSAQKIY